MRDRERAVLVGEFFEPRFDEGFARHLPHGLEHAPVGHAAGGDLPVHHALAVERGMVNLCGMSGHGAETFPPPFLSNVSYVPVAIRRAFIGSQPNRLG